MAKLVLNTAMKRHTISKNIYGHFSEHLGRCIYGGIWVGKDSPIPNTDGIRNDVIEALRKMKIPVLRWPGGCFADEYHWMDGIGPYEKRPKMINTHWGAGVEDNSFGTHEFMRFCELIGADPYVCGNVGSGTVHEMQQWVEYMTFKGVSPMAELRRANGREEPWKLPFFGIGNENWGCGGNMRVEYYADVYRRYATYVRNLGGSRIYKIACGANVDDYHWTEVMMREVGFYMQGLSLHKYTSIEWPNKGSATDFNEKEWFLTMKDTLRMDDLVTKHSTIMDRYDPDKKIGLIVDEWGTWHDVEPGTHPFFLYQQNTIRDALVAGVSLNIFNNHCDRVKMANIAQLVNVLQAVILTDEEKMILTPTYHVFDMYKVHQDAELIPITIESGEYRFEDKAIPQISASASIDSEGKTHISLCNMSHESSAEISIRMGDIVCSAVSGTILTAKTINAHNTFDAPENVKPEAFNGARIEGDTVSVSIPARSVLVLEVR